ncbi:MAG: gamma-glutamyltransferase [Planctomycetota bacterium]|nr:gamma-glutamyltransferase [Planctomycetota bacterium]
MSMPTSMAKVRSIGGSSAGGAAKLARWAACVALWGVMMSTSVSFGREVFPTAAVAADHPEASLVGVEILKRGGNAIDAAVATSFALSVVRPYSCGIGGGGFIVAWLSDKHPRGPGAFALNYREQAPAAAHEGMFDGDPAEASQFGGKAVAIPGTVAGLLHALEEFGTMDRADVLAPAIALAERGFLVDEHYAQVAREIGDTFDKHPDHARRFVFLYQRFLRERKVALGDRITLSEQAAALRLIARDGQAAFASGEIGQAIVEAVNADGGNMTLADLASFKVDRCAVLDKTFSIGGRRFRVLSMPPPSSGGIVVQQVLGMIESRAELAASAHNSPAYIHAIAEASKHAFADRARWIADPAFAPVPVEQLLDGAYLRNRAASINLQTPSRELDSYGWLGDNWPDKNKRRGVRDDSGTSHLSVVDAQGNAVACTETINLEFGSRVGVDRFGFLLNDEMDDFLPRRGALNAFDLEQAETNLPQAGKRPLSSMTPVIVLEIDASGNERVLTLAGASGGPRIISGTLQALLNVLVFDLDAQDAVDRPRFHHQWKPDVLRLEPALLNNASVADDLRSRGIELAEKMPIGAVQLIRRTRDGQGWDAASDPRKRGKPSGY